MIDPLKYVLAIFKFGVRTRRVYHTVTPEHAVVVKAHTFVRLYLVQLFAFMNAR
jgi:hypothetical protein